MLFMFVTVVPYALMILLTSLLGASGQTLYVMARHWLRWSIETARWIMGIEYRIHGFSHLPVGDTSPAILLVKHQSTYETFLMPVIMPHPLAYAVSYTHLTLPTNREV